MTIRSLLVRPECEGAKSAKVELGLSLLAYYALCPHATIRAAPAMEIGVEKSAVSIAELLERCGE